MRGKGGRRECQKHLVCHNYEVSFGIPLEAHFSWIFIPVTKSKLSAFGTIQNVPTDKGRKEKQKSRRSRL